MAFAKCLSEVSSGDGSLSKNLMDHSSNSNSSGCITASVLLSKMRINQKTPSRTPGKSFTPCRSGSDRSTASRKTPNQSDRSNLMPNRSNLEHEGDRFIPNRSSSDLIRAHHVMKDSAITDNIENTEYERAICDSLNICDSSNTRILRYKTDVRDVVTNVNTNVKSPVKKACAHRFVPRVPDKVLDAPEIIDDFYLNLVDWSPNNLLAIALNQEIYLWNANSGEIACLMSTGLQGEYVTSVCWSPDVPDVLAVGLSEGRVQLWNSTTQSLLRTMRLGDGSSAGRVPVVTWRDHIITSGSRSGHVRQHDTRIAHHEVGISDFHTQEVCGLAWSPDKRFLASGANDNCVAVWPASILSERNSVRPQNVLSEHQAAVKALAWCPWKPNLLCTGGGTADHMLRFWNATTGNCVKSIDVTSQVSGIIWNTEYREIITSHGGPDNQLAIWKYPDISLVTKLSEHQGRVLCMTSSPNHEFIASCAADETLRIWHCFEVDHMKKRVEEKTQRASVYTRGFR